MVWGDESRVEAAFLRPYAEVADAVQEFWRRIFEIRQDVGRERSSGEGDQ